MHATSLPNPLPLHRFFSLLESRSEFTYPTCLLAGAIGADAEKALCDAEVLGPWVNPRWLNILASFIIGVLLILSGTLVVTTLFSNLNAALTAIWIAAGLVATVLALGAGFWLTRSRRSPKQRHPKQTMSAAERMNWRMPPLALLKPVEWSSGRKTAMLLLRGYLIVSVLLLIVKAIELGGGFKS